MAYSFSTYGRNISKILRAIDLLARPQGASNKELASHLGLSSRSVFRLLTTLSDLGFPLTDEREGFGGETRHFLLESSSASSRTSPCPRSHSPHASPSSSTSFSPATQSSPTPRSSATSLPQGQARRAPTVSHIHGLGRPYRHAAFLALHLLAQWPQVLRGPRRHPGYSPRWPRTAPRPPHHLWPRRTRRPVLQVNPLKLFEHRGGLYIFLPPAPSTRSSASWPWIASARKLSIPSSPTPRTSMLRPSSHPPSTSRSTIPSPPRSASRPRTLPSCVNVTGPTTRPSRITPMAPVPSPSPPRARVTSFAGSCPSARALRSSPRLPSASPLRRGPQARQPLLGLPLVALMFKRARRTFSQPALLIEAGPVHPVLNRGRSNRRLSPKKGVPPSPGGEDDSLSAHKRTARHSYSGGFHVDRVQCFHLLSISIAGQERQLSAFSGPTMPRHRLNLS